MNNQLPVFKPFYRRNLPHLQPKGGTFFVTYRLNGSIPFNQLKTLKMKYEVELKSLKNDFPKKNYYLVKNLRVKFFQEYDNLLDKMLQGPTFLKIPEIANLVQENLQTFDEELYDLIAYCIMPNHVHLLIDTSIQFPKIWNGENLEQLKITPLMQIMKRIKGPTAVYANRFLNKSGKFWHRESYDRLIRDKKELNNTIAYILENPVKARLVKNWQDWPFSFYKYS